LLQRVYLESMRSRLLVTWLCLASAQAFANTNLLAAGSPKNLDGDQLIKIGELHEVQNHLQEALPYYERAVTEFRTKRNHGGEAVALLRAGRVLQRQERYEAALSSLQAAAAIRASAVQPVTRAEIFLGLGEVYERLERTAEAQRAYGEARDHYRVAKETEGYIQSLVRLGSLLSRQAPSVEALVVLREAIAEAQKQRLHALELTATVMLGETVAKERRQEATAIYEHALTLALSGGDRSSEARIRERMAELLHTTGQADQAWEMAQRALGLYQSLRDRPHEAGILSLLANLRRKAGDVEGAVEYHERALVLYRALRDRPREASELIALSELYTERGEEQSAIEAQRKANVLMQPAP
jgi:tetratricopeptide (TPR) repeat protein